MAAYFLVSFVTGIWGIMQMEPHHVEHNVGIEVGQQFSDLEPEVIEALHKAPHKDIYMGNWLGNSAPNTDGCIVYSATCKPDFWHHIYHLPVVEHPGHFYTVTFSYNWHVLIVVNDYFHS